MRTVGTRWLGALLLLPLLAACGFGAPKQVEPVQTPEGEAPVVPPPPVRSTGSDAPIMGDWRPVTGEPGKQPTVRGPGLFLVDAETGQSEFWPAPTGVDARVQLTPDSRYVWAATPKGSVVADREQRLSYHWTSGNSILLGIADGVLLWEELDASGGQTGRLRLEQLDGTLIKSFTLTFPTDPGVSPHFTRSTRVSGRTFLVGKIDGREWRVDSQTGEATEGPWTDLEASRFDHVATRRQYGGGLYQNTLPLVTVTKAGQHEYRVLAAYPSCDWAGITSSLWRADGEGLLLWSSSGPFMADLPSGRMEPIDHKVGEAYLDPTPSPTQNDRWGALLFTEHGLTLSSFGPSTKPIASGSINWDRMGLSLDTRTPLWSANGRYLQFQAFLGGGKDFGCVTEMTGQPFLPPKVERAPFGEIAVQVATDGDCLNLRAEPSTESRVLTCLRDETRLTLLKKPEGGNGPYFGFYPGWALVQASESSGWVSTEGGYLKWAD